MRHKNAHNYKTINIPGGSTQAEDNPIVQVVSANGLTKLVVIYHTGQTLDTQPKQAEITFLDVLEYRWISDVITYYPFDDDHNFAFGLIEIHKSAYLEDIAKRGKYKNKIGKRFGPYINESDVKHFRLFFDDYGYFEVIAFEVQINEIFK